MSVEEGTGQEVLRNPEKLYSFCIMRPGGNDTALVRGIVRDPGIRKEVNDTIMALYPVEQVGFIDLTPGKEEGVMAGGEFCANFTRSEAWLARNGKPGELDIQISGAEGRLRAGITPSGDAFAQMPIYADPNRLIDDTDRPGNVIVQMQGITQYINFDMDDIRGRTPEEIKAAGMALIRKKGLNTYPAAGVMYAQMVGDSWRITPVVYVRDADTLFLETACGSGTTALGMVLARRQGGSITDVPIIQPSGLSINVSVEFDGSQFGYAQVSGPVEMITEGVLVENGDKPYVIEKITRSEDLDTLFDLGLITLYKEIFAEPPYFESFSDDEVRDMFIQYVSEGMLFIARDTVGILGFGAAVPLSRVPGVYECVSGTFPYPENVWYMADLGVRKADRNKGIGKKLVTRRLEQIKGKTALMRTSENNIISQSLYYSLGFMPVTGAEQQVRQDRMTGSVETDRRIFFAKKI